MKTFATAVEIVQLAATKEHCIDFDLALLHEKEKSQGKFLVAADWSALLKRHAIKPSDASPSRSSWFLYMVK